MSEKVCRDCHLISFGHTCPNCKAIDLSDDFSGLAIILTPKDSVIAKIMKIEQKGRYALRVR